MASDPLAPPPNANPALVWLVNVLFQFDCFVAAVFTGAREKTISCWLGEVEERRFGPGWYWLLSPIWLPVNAVARRLFGQANHCEESVGPFIVEEDKP